MQFSARSTPLLAQQGAGLAQQGGGAGNYVQFRWHGSLAKSVTTGRLVVAAAIICY